MSKGIFSDPLVNFKTCVRPLSVGSFYLKGATIFGFVKSMRPNKDTLFKNSSKNALCTLLTIFGALSVPVFILRKTGLDLLSKRVSGKGWRCPAGCGPSYCAKAHYRDITLSKKKPKKRIAIHKWIILMKKTLPVSSKEK